MAEHKLCSECPHKHNSMISVASDVKNVFNLDR